MAKNLLLEYSEELATKCERLCKSISGNSNTVFQLRKSSSSVFFSENKKMPNADFELLHGIGLAEPSFDLLKEYLYRQIGICDCTA